jgi:hypothetical protein
MDITLDWKSWSVIILAIFIVENLVGHVVENYFVQRAAKITADIREREHKLNDVPTTNIKNVAETHEDSSKIDSNG